MEEAVLKRTEVERKIILGGRWSVTNNSEAGRLPQGGVVSARASGSAGPWGLMCSEGEAVCTRSPVQP